MPSDKYYQRANTQEIQDLSNSFNALEGSFQYPKDILIYYGYLNSFNSGTNAWVNEAVAQDFSRYRIIVLGDGVEAPTHPDYANTQIIIPRIKALNPSCLIFGYVAANQLLANFQTKVTQWNTLQVHGIMMDMSGYDFGVTRAQFNVMLDYVHGKTYANRVFANAWNTDHVLGVANDVSYPNTTYNPTYAPSHLHKATDWIMLESFAVNTDAYSGNAGYESGAEWIARGQKAVNLRTTYGINLGGVGVIGNTNANGADLFDFGYISALMWALEGYGTSDTSYASGTAQVTYWARPSTADVLIYESSPTVKVSVSDADVYLRYLDSAMLMLDFSTGAQLSQLTKLNMDDSKGKNIVYCQTVLSSNLAPGTAGFLLISNRAYFVYLGMVINSIIVKYVEFHVSTAGGGAQTVEVGLFSSPLAPNKANQSVSKIISTGTVDSLTGTGVKRNTAAFTNTIPVGTHLWAGIRTAMAAAQPTIFGLAIDMAQGQVLSTSSAGVLTGTGPWTGAIIAASTSAICPDLRGVLS
jgi:hypothetical protein